MADTYENIDEKLANWIRQQNIFFVATAPLAGDGHVNCSPKGGDSFRVLNPTTVAYQDFTGSGVETIAHLRENGRIVIMFCAFTGATKIVRLHGWGEVLMPNHPEFYSLANHFPSNPGTRAFIRVQVRRVSDSCGYAVPLYDFKGPREVLDKWAENKGDTELKKYRDEKNSLSIDDLPGLIK